MLLLRRPRAVAHACWLLAARAQATAARPAPSEPDEPLVLQSGWAPSDSGAKRVIFIRHAEGTHNRDARDMPNYFDDGLGHTDAYIDARLTPEGEAQCTRLMEQLQWRHEQGFVELVVVSPLTRALQTASLAFPHRPPDAPRPPFLATELARERIWDHTCDMRRERPQLEAEFPHVDFSEVPLGPDGMWAHKEDEPSAWESTKCAARAADFLRWLWARPERHVAVVTHWCFLTHLFAPTNDAKLQDSFGNAEMRFASLMTRPMADALEKAPKHDEL